jgi:ribosomal protein S18 acetylase RimI-like enzyme
MEQPLQIERFTPATTATRFAELADIHCAEIRDGFLTTLGPRFLRNLYAEIVGSPHAFLFAAIRQGKVAGFICGAESTGRVYKHYLRRRGLRDGWRLLPKLVTYRRIKSVLETLLYPTRRQHVELPKAEILNFCVRADVQRTGVGRRLFRHLVAEFRRRNITEIRIVTGESQTSAQRFYESLGAVRVANLEIHQGRQSIAYTYDTKSLPSAADAA